MASSIEEDQLYGARVSSEPSPTPLQDAKLQGNYVTLMKVPQDQIQSMWQELRLPELWTYLPPNVPSSAEEFSMFFVGREGFIVYAIMGDRNRLSPGSSHENAQRGKHTDALGVVAFLNIEPQNRAIEIGGVLYGPSLQRTAAATEVQYLMLRHAFGDDEHKLSPPYRRVVWKCNKLNTKSRRAAERLGFVYEGTFRNHLIVKGRSRDSDWLSIVDDEWPLVKAGLEAWLDDENFDGHGNQKLPLEEVRGNIGG